MGDFAIAVIIHLASMTLGFAFWTTRSYQDAKVSNGDPGVMEWWNYFKWLITIWRIPSNLAASVRNRLKRNRKPKDKLDIQIEDEQSLYSELIDERDKLTALGALKDKNKALLQRNEESRQALDIEDEEGAMQDVSPETTCPQCGRTKREKYKLCLHCLADANSWELKW